MVDTLEGSLIGVRDRALLLNGFAGASRRSELVGLDVRDIHCGHDGLTVFIRKSKTDQEGQGRKVGIPYGSHPLTCPVRAFGAWPAKCGLTEGPLFRSVTRHGRLQPGRLSDRAVALIVKRAAEKAGLDPDLTPPPRGLLPPARILRLQKGVARSARQRLWAADVVCYYARRRFSQTGEAADHRIWEGCQQETRNALAAVREAERAKAK